MLFLLLCNYLWNWLGISDCFEVNPTHPNLFTKLYISFYIYLCILKCPVHMDSSEEPFIMVLAPQSTTKPFLIHVFLCLFIENRLRGHVCYNEPVASIGIFSSWAAWGLTGARWVQVPLWGAGAVTWAGERYWKLLKGR